MLPKPKSFAEHREREKARKKKIRERRKLREGEPGYRKPVGIRTREAGEEEPVRKERETIYSFRNRVLRWLGYKTYKAYLASPLWQGIRQRVLERDNHRCRMCNNPAEACHHDEYSKDVIEGARIDLIRAVCSWCHLQLELDDMGVKRGLGTALHTESKQ